jgi:hypothetical protein
MKKLQSTNNNKSAACGMFERSSDQQFHGKKFPKKIQKKFQKILFRYLCSAANLGSTCKMFGAKI